MHPFTARWLARFAFSFLVVGFFLGWEGYRRYTAIGAVDWRTLLYLLAAIASLLMGLSGIRQRHQRP